VDHEAEVRLVEAHPEGRGGHERLHVVADQGVLELEPALGLRLAAVGVRVHALRAQERGDPRGVGDREHVDHAGALEAGDDLGEPRHPLGLRARLEQREGEGLPGERAALRHELGAELRLDVLDHAVVRRRGGAQDRDALRQQLEDPDQPPVVGPEVVAPVADAVRLVDHEQARAGGDRRQDVGAERRVVEPLGRDEEQVDLVGIDRGGDLLPIVSVLAVNREGSDARALGHPDLVAHQREERRHEDRRPGAGVAEQPRRDEVHGRLAPTGALDEEVPAALSDDGVDRLALALAEPSIGPGDRIQKLEGVIGHPCAR
jgi:hypothetical protein